MGNIVLLDDLTINQIAAGEVIERPASVVKELVENSIDAGATSVSIETKNGGISYIRITDNGKGFMPDDMEIAFERHATSKIRSAKDLETVKSMGFRGEALASIAAIAKVELISRTQDNDIGYKIVVEGGNIISKEEVGCPKGTTITVENLFFNTPVRYKFLKKDFTESGYIEDVVTRIALVNPNIAIKLINSGKNIIQTTGNGDNKSVIYNIYGKDVAENILNVDYTYDDIRITGVIGKPAIARSNRANQLFFVNKRYIKDKTLTGAAEQGFKGLLTIGKFGFLILNLDVDPHKVDVNVHPAKLEVRFEEESKIFKAVYHAIKDTLLQGDLVREPEKQEENERIDAEAKKYKNIFGTNANIGENKIADTTNNSVKTEVTEERKSSIDKLYEINPEIGGLFKKMIQNTQVTNINKSEDLEATGNTKKEENLTESEKTKLEEIKEDDKIKEEELKANSEIKVEEIEKIEDIEKNPEEKKDEKKESIEEENISNKIEDSNKTIENPEEEKLKEEKEADELANITKKINELENNKMEIDSKNFEEMYVKTFGRMPVTSTNTSLKEEDEEYKFDEVTDVNCENINIFSQVEKNIIPRYKFVGIAFKTYIIIELDNELYIIDQHAAHERIMYEKVKKNYYSDGPKESQLMLLPDIITLTHKEMGIAKDNLELFEKAGFTLEEFGDNTIKISGVPNICIDLETKELFLETLDEINTVARTAKQEIEEKFIATIACKSAVKANMALTAEEVDNLMKELLVLPNPFTCPHGRPTAIKMTKTDIEKKFSRRK